MHLRLAKIDHSKRNLAAGQHYWDDNIAVEHILHKGGAKI